MSTNNQKKLKLGTPFTPVGIDHQPQQQRPYEQLYNQQQPQQNQQSYPQKDIIGGIALEPNGTQPVEQSQQATQAPKPKKRLQLVKTTNTFIPDDGIQKKLEEEIQKKKLEEEQKQKELRKPRPYTAQELMDKLNEIKDFATFLASPEWLRLKERVSCGGKEIAVKTQQPRKDGKQNNYKSSTNQRDSARPQQQQQQPIQSFNKGTNVQQPTDQQEKKPQQLIIHRVSEDIATKSKKDEMKQQAEAFIQQMSKTPEEKELIKGEIKYRLNQLAPDNFDVISTKLLQILIDNTTEQETTYLSFLAEKIIEKSQTEPKYRKLYTRLCQILASDKKLVGVNTKGTTNSLFKNSLRNQVQKVFQDRKKQQAEDLSHMRPEEKEQYHIIRKTKIMGNVRFIGDLFIMKQLPFVAIYYAINDLISEYLQQYVPKGENSEESIEGIIELIDQIGPSYKASDKIINASKPEVTQAELEKLLDGQKKSPEACSACFSNIGQYISIDHIQLIFDRLKSYYSLSQRISMLIENVLDRKKQGWKDHYSKQDQAQTVKAIQQEQEKEIIEQNYNQSKAKGGRKQQIQEESPYVEKNPSSKAPQFDISEILSYVNGTFGIDAQVQVDKLREELKRIGGSTDAVQKFFEKIFECMLDLKFVKRNIQRSSLIFELLLLSEANGQLVTKAIQKILTEDKVYDLAESPAARELFVDIISFFLNESDIETLKKFYCKPLMEVEDFTDFIGKVYVQLIDKFPDDNRIKLLNDYFGFLGYDINSF